MGRVSKVLPTRSRCAAAAIAALIALALACGMSAAAPAGALAVEPDAQQASAKSPTITATYAGTGKVTVQAGATYKLGAKASGAKLSYKSSNKAVATVTSKGAVKAKKAGKATITITAKKGKTKATKKVKVTVVAKKSYRQVKSIAAKAAKTTLTVGQTATVKTTFKPAKASNKNLVYKSSNTKVLTVNAKGKVTAKSQGTAKVTVTSAANKKAKKTITFTVKAKAAASSSSGAAGSKSSSSSAASGKSGSKSSSTGSGSGSSAPAPTEEDDPVEADPDVISPLQIDADHEDVVEYADAVTVLDGVEWSDEGGNVTVDPASLPSDLSAGDVVVLSPTAEHPQGRSIVLVAAPGADGTLLGDEPSLDQVFDEIDIETTGFVSTSGFVPEDDVELLSVESGGLETQTQTQTGDTLSTQGVLEYEGFESTFSFSYKGVSFSVTPSAAIKVDYSFGKLNEVYAAVTLKESLSYSLKGSNLLGGGIPSKKLGNLYFSTPVPGLYLEAALYLNLGADGTVSFKLDAEKTGGFRYLEGDFSIVNQSSATPKVEADLTLKAGLDVTGSLNILAKPIADLSIGGDFKLGASTKDAKVRDNGTVCGDLKLTVSASINVGKHNSLMHDLGLSWEKKLGSKELKKWHLENGKLVGKCTWAANKRTYEQVSELVPSDESGGSGSQPGSGGSGSGDGEADVPDISGVTVQASMEDYSWAQLKSIADAISAASSDEAGLAIAKKYHLLGSDGKLTGDERKSLTLLDGTESSVQILGFRHDDKTDGGKAGITFGFADVPAERVMNSTFTNEGGWKASEMRAWLASDFFALLPPDVASCIVSVDKRTNNMGKVGSNGVAAVSTTDDKAWLMSFREVFGDFLDWSHGDVYNAEGAQYKLYVDNGVGRYGSFDILKKYGKTTTWWLRSPNAGSSENYYYVKTYYGEWRYNYTNDVLGVSPGFCF